LLLDEAFTVEEKQEIKNLGIPKPSLSIDIGIDISLTKKSHLETGISHKWLRIGTKKYGEPVGIASPFYKRKQTLIQNQISLYFKYVYKPLSKRNICSLFVRGDAVYNYRNYIIREVTFDVNNKRGFIGKIKGDNIKFHSTDIRMSTGLNAQLWSKNKRAILLEGYIGGYLRPYKAFGNFFLPLIMDTNGLVWEFGINVVYKFDIRK